MKLYTNFLMGGAIIALAFVYGLVAPRISSKPAPTQVDFHVRFGWSAAQLASHNQVEVTTRNGWYQLGRSTTNTFPIVHLVAARGTTLTLPVAENVELNYNEHDGAPIRQVQVTLKMPETPGRDPSGPEYSRYQSRVHAIYETLFQAIRAGGWKRYYSPRSPRLTGLDSYRFDTAFRKDKFASMPGLSVYRQADPYCMLTLAQWRHLDPRASVEWRWSSPNALLRVNYSPSYSLGNGFIQAARISVNVVTDLHHVLSYAKGDMQQLDHAKKVLESRLPEWRENRRKWEARLKKRGASLATDYENPPIYGIQIAPHALASRPDANH